MIVCDNASLKMGGEAARPLHYFRTLRARGADVYLSTHTRCRNELTKILGDDIDRVYFAPDTWLHILLWKIGKPFPDQLQISTVGAIQKFMTQRYQAKVIRKLVKEKGLQVIHQPTPISPKQPSALGGFGVPMVIGPLNGDINYPPAFSYMEKALTKWTVVLGRVLGNIANQIVRGKLNADVMLVSNERTRRALPTGTRGKVIQLTANAVDLGSWDANRQLDPAEPHFGFLGRLVDFKMVDLLLEAFVPVAKQHNARLDIIGEGDERAKLEAIAKKLGIASSVTFHGWKNYKDSAEILAKASALVFPSLRECGGAVVMEAMAVGLPVIAADWGGPADYVGDDGAGILIKPDTKEGFIQGLTDAMSKLASSPDLVHDMSTRARNRAVTQFQWDSRVDALIDVYREVTARA